ncbi:hypothetical protein A6P54_12680 [Bacillus sp. MKU004]|nr:hypothetical protein A6P54_12680 [Bacillus sp. MKU004]
MFTQYENKKNGLVTKPFFSTTFSVDIESNWLTYKISFSKKGWYSIFLWDPKNQLRSQSLYINQEKEITISANPDKTSFSSISGKLPAGEWTLEILTPTYKASPTFYFDYDFGIELEEVKTRTSKNWAEPNPGGFTLSYFDFNKIYNSEAKWYKGDFHTHTNESDGKLTPMEGLHQAKRMGLDFFTATDHNILPSKWIDDPDMMIVPGVEITSSKGHFNALGLSKWIDWRPICKDGGMETEEGMNRVINEARNSGAIISINHPMLKPWEWQFTETKLSLIDVIEIWNDPTYKDNPLATEEALAFWNTLWNDGHRIYGIGGSDSHLLPTESYEKGGPPSLIGDPATYIKLNELSPSSLLEGILQGEVYVSRGPVLDFHLEMEGKYINISNVDLREYHTGIEPTEFTYSVTYRNVKPESFIHWILNGVEISKEPVYQDGTLKKTFSWSKDAYNWLRFEIREADGTLSAFNNPIFQGEKRPSLQTWGECMKDASLIK